MTPGNTKRPCFITEDHPINKETSLGSQFQCSVTLTMKFLLIFLWNFLCSCVQLAPVAPCPITGCHWEEPGSILLTHTLYIFININEVTFQYHLLQAKETQLPQPFLLREMLQSLHHCGSVLYSLKHFPVLLERRGPELDTVHQVWSHQGTVGGGETNLSQPLISCGEQERCLRTGGKQMSLQSSKRARRRTWVTID